MKYKYDFLIEDIKKYKSEIEELKKKLKEYEVGFVEGNKPTVQEQSETTQTIPEKKKRGRPKKQTN